MGQAQCSIDIARSSKVLLRDILTYDNTVQSQIFDNDMTVKHDKSSLMKTLESSLIKDFCSQANKRFLFSVKRSTFTDPRP